MDFRVYVIVEIPVIDKKIELLLPVDRRMHDILAILKRAFPLLSDGYYKNVIPNFYRKSNGEVIGLNNIIKDSNIKNGTRLVLV